MEQSGDREPSFTNENHSTPIAYNSRLVPAKPLNPLSLYDFPFQGDTACITFRRVAPLLRFSKKILLTFRHGG